MMPLGFMQAKNDLKDLNVLKWLSLAGRRFHYVDDTITKKVMANVNATSFGVQFIWKSQVVLKSLKANIATVQVHKSEQDFIIIYDITT